MSKKNIQTTFAKPHRRCGIRFHYVDDRSQLSYCPTAPR